MEGLLKDPIVVSRRWFESMAPPQGLREMEASMKKLLTHTLDRFISTSGNVLLKEQVQPRVAEAVQKAFSNAKLVTDEWGKKYYTTK